MNSGEGDRLVLPRADRDSTREKEGGGRHHRCVGAVSSRLEVETFVLRVASFHLCGSGGQGLVFACEYKRCRRPPLLPSAAGAVFLPSRETIKRRSVVIHACRQREEDPGERGLGGGGQFPSPSGDARVGAIHRPPSLCRTVSSRFQASTRKLHAHSRPSISSSPSAPVRPGDSRPAVPLSPTRPRSDQRAKGSRHIVV